MQQRSQLNTEGPHLQVRKILRAAAANHEHLLTIHLLTLPLRFLHGRRDHLLRDAALVR